VMDGDTDKSRGFGFVEMANAEDGEKAIAALNGTLLEERALNVNEARPRLILKPGAHRSKRLHQQFQMCGRW
jgi:RNA recognition motif-containing protein